MFRNYLKIAFRSILRNRLFTVINTVGLAVGISCVLMIFLFIEYELDFDRFHENRDQIYRVVKEHAHQNGTDYRAETQFPLVHALRLDYPDLKATRFFNRSSANITVDEKVFNEPNVMFVDSVFFNLFTFRWIKGSPDNSLKDPNSVVLTQSLADKYFPQEDAIGKVIKIKKDRQLKVSGIIGDAPQQSSIPFSMLIPLEFLNEDFTGFTYDSWNHTNSGFESYVLLPAGLTPEAFNDRLALTLSKYLAKTQIENETYYLQPLRKIHFASRYGSLPNAYTMNSQTLWIFALIGLLILCIAIINFVNLSTAQALKRAREVGVRKTLGAYRGHIYLQFMFETVLLTLGALLLSVVITEIFLPHLNDFLGRKYQLGIYRSHYFFAFLVLLFVSISFLTGFYPAMVLSGFKPVKALKGSQNAAHVKGLTLRNGLVVFQFVISIILIISVLIISEQINFIRGKDLGFIRQNRIILELPRSDAQSLKQFKNRLLSYTEITHVSFGIGGPTSHHNMTTNFDIPGQASDQEMRLNIKAADTSYFRTNGLSFLAGGPYAVPHPDDPAGEVVVNEKMVSMIGLSNPYDAVGKIIQFNGVDHRITGVVSNFHIYSLHDPITPLAFIYYTPHFLRGIVGFADGTELKAIAHIEEMWKEFFPGTFIEYENYGTQLENYYIGETKIFSIVTFFSIIAILIGCLGLFGLVSIMVVQKSREIGIRKILGARRPQIIGLLSVSFLRWILLANIIAWPVAFYALSRWLENFTYRVGFQWWVFLAAAFLSLAIAFFSILYHALKAASVNPVDTIKYE